MNIPLCEKLKSLDLNPVIFKVLYENAVGSNDKDFIFSLAEEYRRFLYLCAVYPDKQIVPSEYVDAFWHAHILDTRKYAVDCQEVFGYFLHHYPYLGVGYEGAKAELSASYADSLALYEVEFNEKPFYLTEAAVCSGGGSCHGVVRQLSNQFTPNFKHVAELMH
jgi:hypothetical protein